MPKPRPFKQLSETPPAGTLGIILVTYGNEASLAKLLAQLSTEKQPGDYIVLIDNHPAHGCAAIADKTPVVDKVLRSKNIGFAAGCNAATKALPDTMDLILFLNPDVQPAPGAIAKLRHGGRQEWSAWMGLLLLPDGSVNSAGTVVHFSGLSWCGSFGQPADYFQKKRAVDALSGACLMIRRSVWAAVGGFTEDYFMYYEDTDLSMTLRQKGLQLGLVPEARFTHDYHFEKGQRKWFYLERNRYVLVTRQWPIRVVIVSLPFLAVTEVGLWFISLFRGKLLLRMKAVWSFVRIAPRLIRSRHGHRITALEFFNYLQPTLSTPLLGWLGRSRVINAVLSGYYRLAQLALKISS